MSTPIEPLPGENYASAFAAEPITTTSIDPNNPPWGIGTALLVWLASVAMLVVMQALVIIPYALLRYGPAEVENITKSIPTDPNFVFLSIAAIIPAHLLTLAVVWALVTSFGKRPFWQTLGWSWGQNMGFWTSAGVAVALLLVGIVLTKLLGGGETQLDQMIASSPAARFAIAFLAIATAPLVEELIYRGVLYPPLQRAIGMLWAIIFVSTLFTLVHVAQYSNNFGVIAAVGLLGFSVTYVRARTGRLLPCFVIHLVFNGLQSLAIVFEPYLRQFGAQPEKQTAALTSLIHLLGMVA